MKFVELAGFGLNMLTVAFIATIVFSLIQLWGLEMQARTIRKLESIESLSVPCFVYFLFHFVCFVVYGFRAERLGPVICGLILGFMHLRVLDVAIDYKARVSQYLIPAVVGVALVFLALPILWAQTLMSILYCVGAAFIVQVPIEMIRTQKQGVVSIRWILTMGASIFFWWVYGLVMKDVVLWVTCLISLIALSTALALCEIFKKREVKTP
ncbi:MAG: hypothetical protein RLY57_244 [Candidatus Parcubacteria bacterium]